MMMEGASNWLDHLVQSQLDPSKSALLLECAKQTTSPESLAHILHRDGMLDSLGESSWPLLALCTIESTEELAWSEEAIQFILKGSERREILPFLSSIQDERVDTAFSEQIISGLSSEASAISIETEFMIVYATALLNHMRTHIRISKELCPALESFCTSFLSQVNAMKAQQIAYESRLLEISCINVISIFEDLISRDKEMGERSDLVLSIAIFARKNDFFLLNTACVMFFLRNCEIFAESPSRQIELFFNHDIDKHLKRAEFAMDFAMQFSEILVTDRIHGRFRPLVTAAHPQMFRIVAMHPTSIGCLFEWIKFCLRFGGSVESLVCAAFDIGKFVDGNSENNGPRVLYRNESNSERAHALQRLKSGSTNLEIVSFQCLQKMFIFSCDNDPMKMVAIVKTIISRAKNGQLNFQENRKFNFQNQISELVLQYVAQYPTIVEHMLDEILESIQEIGKKFVHLATMCVNLLSIALSGPLPTAQIDRIFTTLMEGILASPQASSTSSSSSISSLSLLSSTPGPASAGQVRLASSAVSAMARAALAPPRAARCTAWLEHHRTDKTLPLQVRNRIEECYYFLLDARSME